MEVNWVSPAVSVALAMASGLVVWVWTLWQSHEEHRRHVIDKYATKDDMKERLLELAEPIHRELRTLHRLMSHIADKLEIPAVHRDDDY